LSVTVRRVRKKHHSTERRGGLQVHQEGVKATAVVEEEIMEEEEAAEGAGAGAVVEANSAHLSSLQVALEENAFRNRSVSRCATQYQNNNVGL